MELPGVTRPIPTESPQKPSPMNGGKMRLLTLDDLDGRTAAAKRAQALRDAIMSDLGGEDSLSAIKRSLADSVAISTAIIEDAYARWLRNDPGVNLGEITTLANARRRDAQLIGLDRVAKDITDLDAWIAAR